MAEATGGDVMVQVLHAVTELQRGFGELRHGFEVHAKRMDQRFEQMDQRFEQMDQRLTSLEGHATLTNHRLTALESFAERTDQRFAEITEHNRRTDERIVQMLQSLTDLWRLGRRLEQGLARLETTVEQLADTTRLQHRDHEARLLILEKKRA